MSVKVHGNCCTGLENVKEAVKLLYSKMVNFSTMCSFDHSLFKRKLFGSFTIQDEIVWKFILKIQ